MKLIDVAKKAFRIAMDTGAYSGVLDDCRYDMDRDEWTMSVQSLHQSKRGTYKIARSWAE